MSERAITFRCSTTNLHGILHVPEAPAKRGVLIVVGGPQYRVGSHRQFVLLARDLAAAGIPVMRFDYRGMGDSEGDEQTFEDAHDDIAAAIDCFLREAHGVETVVLWGLCDAASASLAYAPTDARVAGLVLLNPWVRTDAGIAGAYLRTYYWRRVLDRDLWRKIGRGEFDVLGSARSALSLLRAALGGPHRNAGATTGETAENTGPLPTEREPLPMRMLEHLRRFRGRVLLILSGDDLTAEEFRRAVSGSRGWQRELKHARVSRRDLAPANHTFSRRPWRDQVARWTLDWLRSL